MKFKAVIFDLDGTLLNTLEDLAGAMNIVLRQFGLPEHGLAEYKQFVGNGIEALVRRAVPEEQRNGERFDRYVQRMKEEYFKRMTSKSHPYEGIAELLDAFNTAGIPLVVLSNKPDQPTRTIVSRLLAGWRFEKVMGARPEVPTKPNPSAALAIARELKITPSDFLFIGDTPIDMQTANFAGMFAVGALWGFRAVEELIAGGARVLVRDPEDLLPWI